MKMKIRSFEVLEIFCALFPICPSYFYIFGLQVKELILLFTLVAFIMLGSGVVSLKMLKACIPIFIFVFFTGTSQLYHMEMRTLIMQVVLWVGVLLFASTTINTKERFYRLLDILIYAGVVVGIFGFIEEITHFNIFSLLNTAGATIKYNPLRLGILRIISFTSHAISYCTYCMFILALLLYRVEHTEKGEKKKYIYFAVIIAANAMLTLSRIAYIGIFIELVLYLYYSGRKQFIFKTVKYLVILLICVGIGCLFSSSLRRKVQLSVYIVGAYFDDSYITLLRENGFTDNPGGVGNRLDLYGWVYDEMNGKIWFGNGATSKFEHVFVNKDGYNQTKSSIEVEWLRTLYRYGIIGLIGEIILFLSILAKAYFMKEDPENGLGFGKTCFSIVLAYIVVFFGVMQNQDVQAFAVIIMLLLAYKQYNGFGIQKPREEQRVEKYEAIGTN